MEIYKTFHKQKKAKKRQTPDHNYRDRERTVLYGKSEQKS